LNTDVNTRHHFRCQADQLDRRIDRDLNKQIVVATAQAGGQPPNDLLDQRDALVSNLSQLVGVTTTTDSNGALNVFIGNGQPLVLQGVTTTLTTVPNQFNASQLEISTSTNGGNPISGEITSGDLGGLLAARPGDRSGHQSIGSNRHRLEPRARIRSRTRARSQRSVRREPVFGGRAAGDRVEQQRRHRERNGRSPGGVACADAGQLHCRIPERRLFADRCDDRQRGRFHRNRHGGQSDHRRRAVDRLSGAPRSGDNS
jgi:hypothetical protein